MDQKIKREIYGEEREIYYIDYNKLETLEDLKLLLQASRFLEYVVEGSSYFEKLKKFSKDQ